jgi:F-box/leucine-rich repeat protein 14
MEISDLFPEILATIFTYLDVKDKGRVAQVCVKWRDVAYSRSVWKKVEAKLHVRGSNKRKHSSSFSKDAHHSHSKEGVCPTLYPSLVKRGINRVQVLSLKHNLFSLVNAIPDLTSLNLSGCFSVTDTGLNMAFCRDLPCLTTLNLSFCKQVSDMGLGCIAQHLKNLKELQLGGTQLNITNRGLMAISVGLKKLKSLNLRGCHGISDTGISYIAGRSENSMCGNHDLEHLGLQDCQRITDTALEFVSAGLTSLKTIDLSFCFSVTDDGIKFLAKMRSLLEINLRRCNSITDTGLGYLAGLPGQQSLAPLAALDVSFCEKVGDQGLVHLSRLHSLQSLSFCSCDISDFGIEQIVQTLHSLTTLNIGQCTRITDRSLLLISTHMGQLTSIDLYGCNNITTSGLEKIMKLPSLSTLNLGLWHKK